MTTTITRIRSLAALAALATLAACMSEEPEGLYPATPAATTVKFDYFHKPLPEIPLPIDVATRPDPSSATGLRINASIVAPTQFEARTRELVDQLDGWGVMQPISIPFTGPLDVGSIVAHHRDATYDTSDDVIYLVNVDRTSAEFGRIHHIDLGEGNYPVVMEQRDAYGPNDPRTNTLSLLFEETEEDLDDDGVLDPGEDTDGDGVLDHPNYLPGAEPAQDDLGARADALMTFYERETNTVIARPLTPLRERTRYAVIVTRRLLDEAGEPVGSPFDWIHHIGQTGSLEGLADALPDGLELADVAFAFSFTTQTIESSWQAVRDGLYAKGVQHHLGEEFTADLKEVYRLVDPEFTEPARAHLLTGERWILALQMITQMLQGDDPNSLSNQLVLSGQGYVDYFVMGSFDSPQLFARYDADGTWLGYNDQSWPADLDRKPAPAIAERVQFTLAVPRKEVSARGDGKPAPVVILVHGHGGNRFSAMQFSAFFCKFGLAVLAIDGPTHGISLDMVTKLIATSQLGDIGMSSGATAVFKDRAIDMNHDGTTDSGADFWTAYMFHTRDMTRQFALDMMQLVRIVRGFDGTRTWALDEPSADAVALTGLAGDFDGDGVVDIGGDAPIMLTGGSLGGILAMMMAGVEPELSTVVPIVGGGALSTIGVRSTNGGAKVGFMMRAMTPMYSGTIDPDSGAMVVSVTVPDLIEMVTVPLAEADGVRPGDTMVVENLRSGEHGCGLVDPDGKVRAVVGSNLDDQSRVVFYRGAIACGEATPSGEVVATLEAYDRDVDFQDKHFEAGSPILALAEGLGRLRASPELRRSQGLAQLVLDPGDPAALVRHGQLEPMTYPGTGQTTGAHMAMVFTEGDSSVPNASGMVAARAAGMLDYLEVDPRYGKPANQVLIDTYIAEGVDDMKRYVDNTGRGVHIDIENFADGDDVWTDLELPRLEAPLRLGFEQTDPLGGKSAAIFVLSNPVGDHGFGSPGGMIDEMRAACVASCETPEGDDPCGCGTRTTYDVGMFMVNLIGRYFASDGTVLSTDLCQSRNDCDDIPPMPAARE